MTDGVSAREFCTRRRVLGAALVTGEERDAVVGVGVGTAEVTWDLVGGAALETPCSGDFSDGPATSEMLLWGIVLVAAAISRAPGIGRFSVLVSALVGEGLLGEDLLALLLLAGFFSWAAGFAGCIGFDGKAGVTFGVEPALEESRAGKSSSCSTRLPFEAFEP